MRNLKRNQQKIYYSNLTEESVDEWGNVGKGYGEPQEYKISISPNTGETSYSGFGTQFDYDRTMVTTDIQCPINEYSHLWIGIEPTEPHNFEVRKKAPNLNHIAYAIQQVEVSIEKEN
jgi:hypothetical protein